jgi:hypothetical protein
VDAEDKISQSMVARTTQRKSAEMHRPREGEIASPAKMPNGCRPPL